MKKLFLLLAFFLPLFAQAKAYKIVLVTDPEAQTKAEGFMQYVRSTPPFSQLGNKLDIEIKVISAEEMACKQGMTSQGVTVDRIPVCDFSKIRSVGRSAGAHATLAISGKTYGGGGGDIPVWGANNSAPVGGGVVHNYGPSTLLHEFLHKLGLCDEYEYSESEIKVYCSESFKAPNGVVLKLQNPYASDQDARNKHGSKIPWYTWIHPAPTMLIVSGSDLGTSPGVFNPADAGLYRGGSCDKKYPSFKPYYTNTIMRDLSSSQIPPYMAAHILRQISAEIGEKVDLIMLDNNQTQGAQVNQSNTQKKDQKNTSGQGSTTVREAR